MKHCQKICILFVLFIFETVSSCTYSETMKGFECETPVEISAEGTDEWTNLKLYNFKETITLKKDTFKRTPNLKQLILATLTSIEPGAFDGLHKLDKLIIFKSDLKELSVGILDNLSIRSIETYGKINISPGLFANVPDIKIVVIRDNTLKKIKTGIFNNTSIYKLYLESNKLDIIENGAFSNMDSLIFLSLARNYLKSFDSELLLGKSDSLQQLWLNRNNLTKITRSMFSSVGNLANLYLEINQIELIEDGSFYDLPKLYYLDISNNKLKELSSKIFPKEGMKRMNYLFVHNNQFTFFNIAIFIKIPNLKFISYGGNPFQCPCLDDTKEWTDKHNITRLCDDIHFSGERPVCVFTDVAKNNCIYDVDLTDDLYTMYTEALKEYPTLNLKCDTTKGAYNATLIAPP